MRDALLMSIVLLLMLATLRRPWLGIILWVWVSLMNPHRYTFGFAYDAPVAAMAAVSVMLGLLLALIAWLVCPFGAFLAVLNAFRHS